MCCFEPYPKPAPREPYTRRELMLGPIFLTERPESWRPWLERRRHYLHKNVSAMKSSRNPQSQKRLLKAQEELMYTLDVLQNL